MAPGIIEVVGLFVLAVVLGIFPEFARDFGYLPPIEQNLTRVANGFALIVLLVVGLYRFGGGPSVAFANLDDFSAHPGDHWMAITGVALFFYGLFRFIQGVRSCWGCSDGALTNRAFFTTAFGIAAAWFLWVHQSREFLSNGWLVLGWFALLVISAWVALTGGVRLFLLTASGAITATQACTARIRTRWPGTGGGTSSGGSRIGSFLKTVKIVWCTISILFLLPLVIIPGFSAWQKGQNPIDGIRENWAQIEAKGDAARQNAATAAPRAEFVAPPRQPHPRKHFVDQDGKQWW